MGYNPNRSDCTESAAFRRLPMSKAFIEAARIRDFLHHEYPKDADLPIESCKGEKHNE